MLNPINIKASKNIQSIQKSCHVFVFNSLWLSRTPFLTYSQKNHPLNDESRKDPPKGVPRAIRRPTRKWRRLSTHDRSHLRRRQRVMAPRLATSPEERVPYSPREVIISTSSLIASGLLGVILLKKGLMKKGFTHLIPKNDLFMETHVCNDPHMCFLLTQS